MGKKLLFALVIIASGSLFGQSFEWSFMDGTGSKIVKDSGKDHLDGTITDSQHCIWGREDDLGGFLRFERGGSVVVENNKKLLYPDGFSLGINFSCDLSAIASTGFASLLCKGNSFVDGYSVMVGKEEGKLLVYVKGMNMQYLLMDAGIKSNKYYRLEVLLGDKQLQVFLNDKLIKKYNITGKLKDSGGPLHIGSINKYPFSGNIYNVKLGPYEAKKAMPEKAVIPDPPGTIIISDFKSASPAPAVGDGHGDPNRWFFRTDADFVKETNTVLHPPHSINTPELTFDPKLKGKYDVFVVARAIGTPMMLQIKLGDQPDYYTIQTDSADVHRNMEVLLDRDVDMTGKKITFASCGLFYFAYFKFIPVVERRARDNTDPAITVTKRSRLTNEEVDAEAQKDIDAKIKSGYFVERTYIDSKPEPEPAPDSVKRGYILFNRNWMDLLFPVSVPEKDPGKISLEVAATPLEYTPVSFGVRGLRNVEGLTISQSQAFKNAAGKTADIKVDFSIVGEAIKRTTNFTRNSEFMKGPQYLEPAYPLNLKQQQTSQYWITMQAPENTPSGIYTGEFELKSGSNITKIPVKFEVYPFKLDPAKGYDIYFAANLADKAEAKSIIKDFADHALTSILVYSPKTLVLKGKTLEDIEIDFDKSLLTTVSEEFKKYGMPGNIYFFTNALWDRLAECLPSSQHWEGFVKLFKQLEAKTGKENWPRIGYLSYDEILSSPDHLPKFIKEVNLLKKLGALTANYHIWYKTSRPYQKEVDQVADAIDIFINRFATRKIWYVDSWKEMLAEAAKRGKKIQSYNNNNCIVFAQPAGMRYTGGWFFRTAGESCTGNMYWIFNLTRGNPYNDLDGSIADFAYRCPPYGKRKGGPSIDFEAYREGVYDLRYILTLENLITEVKKKGGDTASAEKLLKSLKESFDWELFKKKSLFIDSKWSKCWEKDGKRFASGQYNLPNGWKLSDYDRMRRLIAQEIIKLKSKEKVGVGGK